MIKRWKLSSPATISFDIFIGILIPCYQSSPWIFFIWNTCPRSFPTNSMLIKPMVSLYFKKESIEHCTIIYGKYIIFINSHDPYLWEKSCSCCIALIQLIKIINLNAISIKDVVCVLYDGKEWLYTGTTPPLGKSLQGYLQYSKVVVLTLRYGKKSKDVVKSLQGYFPYHEVVALPYRYGK